VHDSVRFPLKLAPFGSDPFFLYLLVACGEILPKSLTDRLRAYVGHSLGLPFDRRIIIGFIQIIR
jgi:hypothetical protein